MKPYQKIRILFLLRKPVTYILFIFLPNSLSRIKIEEKEEEFIFSNFLFIESESLIPILIIAN